MLVCMCLWWSLCSVMRLIHHLHAIKNSALLSFFHLCPLCLFSLVSSSSFISYTTLLCADYEWHCTKTQPRKKITKKKPNKQRKQSLPSSASVLLPLSLPLSAGRQGRGRGPVTSHLSTSLMAVQISAAEIRLGSYWLSDSLSLSCVELWRRACMGVWRSRRGSSLDICSDGDKSKTNLQRCSTLHSCCCSSFTL